MNTFSSQATTTFLALAAIAAVAWIAVRLVRERLGVAASRTGRNDDALRFVRTLMVGQRERVVLIEHRGERLLLGVAPGSVSLIARFGATVPLDDAVGPDVRSPAAPLPSADPTQP